MERRSEKNEEKEQDTEDEKARLLIQAGNLSEELLQKSFLDIKGMFEQKGRAETRLVELERDLQDLKLRTQIYTKSSMNLIRKAAK